MNQRTRIQRILSFLVVMAFAGAGVASAASATPETIRAGETRSGDQFVGVQTFQNDGAIQGDLFIWAQKLNSSGTIGGDVIGAGEEVKISGSIAGNVRAAGKSLALSARIARNVMVAGMDVSLSRESTVTGSLIACGKTVVLDGTVRGKTRVYGEKVTLKGEFFGDVIVNVIEIDPKDRSDWEMEDLLTVAPGAILHGKLVYQGSAADIQKGASVASFDWIKTKPAPTKWLSKENRKRVWGFIQFLLTTIALFLVGLLMHRWFPALFTKMGEFAGEKPWSAILYGLVAAFSMLPALILLIVLLALYLVLSPGLGILFGSAATSAYLALYVLSTIPVGLWLGNLVFRKNPSVLSRFGLGLLLLNAVVYLLGLLGGLHLAGPLFPALLFIVKFMAVLLGAGILLHGVREFIAAARRI